jgi:hypothetical protein
VHGGRGEALTRAEEMEEEMDKGKKEEALDPIMMEEDQSRRSWKQLEKHAVEYPTNIR